MHKEYELNGTKNKIADQLAKEFNLSDEIRKSSEFKEYVSYFIDILENNYDTLISDDEDFLKDVPRNFSANYGIVTPNANYFISINRFTYLLVLAIAKRFVSMQGLLASVAFGFVLDLVPKEDTELFRKLDQAMGESCVVLEAARNKAKGIGDDYYDRFKGECVNSNLMCRFNQESRCVCKQEIIHRICENLCDEHVLTKKNGRYFYIDLV